MSDISTYNEKALLLSIADGDETAFTQLYRLYVPQLAAFLQGLTHSTAVTDELVQETFVQVWLSRDKMPEVQHPKAWVFRIASNITYNYLKRKVKEKDVLNKLNTGQQEQDAPEESLYLRQMLEAIKEAIDQLSPQRKKIYLLSREAGMTIPQIAEKLNLSVSTVKNTLVTTLQQIREYLQQKGYYISWLFLLLLFF